MSTDHKEKGVRYNKIYKPQVTAEAYEKYAFHYNIRRVLLRSQEKYATMVTPKPSSEVGALRGLLQLFKPNGRWI